MREVLSVSEVPQELVDIVRRVRSTGNRVLLQEQGRPVAAVVSSSDWKALEALEDRLDLLDALDALADCRERGGVSFEEIKDHIDT